MAQVKKPEVEAAILEGAYDLFLRKGYSATSLAEIAASAGISTSNIYVYFPSKLKVLFALYDPWLRERIERLGEEVARHHEPERRLSLVLDTLWVRIPEENNGFANNLMQALSTASGEEQYSRDLLDWAEGRLSEMIRSCLPPGRAHLTDRSLLAHVFFMAFDGFAMNHKLQREPGRMDELIALMVGLLLGEPKAAAG
mgnify:CR=1 FL=1